MEIAQVLQTVLDQLHLPAYVRDAQDRLVYINPAAEALTGWSLAEVQSRRCADIFGAREAGRAPFESRLKTRDGYWRQVRGSEAALSAPPACGAVGVIEDLTPSARTAARHPAERDALAAAVAGQRWAEAALEAQERFVDAVFDTIQDGLSILDTDLTILRVNRVMKTWYADRLPLEGRRCYVCYHQRIGPCTPCPTIRCLQSGRIEREIVKGPEGSAVEWIELFSLPMHDARHSRVIRVVEFVRDITHKVRMEAQIGRIEGP